MMMQSGILRPGEKTSSKKMVNRIMNKAQKGVSLLSRTLQDLNSFILSYTELDMSGSEFCINNNQNLHHFVMSNLMLTGS